LALRFEWDKSKAKRNIAKHKISFEEASTVFGDPFSITIENPIHSYAEERFITMGSSFRGKIIVVIHCDKGDTIRIISARAATRREGKTYEEGK
jgi:hypothetical protein